MREMITNIFLNAGHPIVFIHIMRQFLMTINKTIYYVVSDQLNGYVFQTVRGRIQDYKICKNKSTFTCSVL